MPYQGLGGPTPNVNKPGLTIPALLANFSIPGATNGPYWWQDGNGVTHIGGTALGSTGTGLQQLWAGGTLPLTVKPVLNALFFPIAATDGTIATCEIPSGGALYILNTTASKTWCFDGISFLGGY